MKIATKKYIKWFAVLILGVILAGCTKEDESDCIDTLEIAFSFKRSDGVERFEAEVNSVSLFIFDKNGLLVKRLDENRNNILTNDYTMKVDLDGGDYTLVTWGGLHQNFFSISDTKTSLPDIKEGETYLDDLLLAIEAKDQEHINKVKPIVDYEPSSLFYGNLMSINVPKGSGKVTKSIVDLKRYSTQIRLIMSGLPLPTRSNPFTQFDMYMEAPNGAYDFKDNFDNQNKKITYLANYVDSDANNKLTMDIYTLKLGFGKGYDFTIFDNVKSTVFYTADLLEDYIRKDPRYNTQAKIDMEDYFEIRMDFDANLGVKVWINGWNLGQFPIVIQ